MARKPIKEYRAGLGRRMGGQGMYIRAKSKDEAYEQAIKAYMRKYNCKRAYAKTRVKKSHMSVWRNADGSVPAWRKRK